MRLDSTHCSCTSTILSTLKKTIKKHKLFSSSERLIVGVSGGPDSVALLYLLRELALAWGFTIIVAHLNHGIRGKKADDDEQFVRATAEKLGVACVVGKISWKKSAQKIPDEETLRTKRFGFFFSVARKFHAKKIVLAHTLDDQAETVLMRLVRGTGLHGLVSIAPKRSMNGFEIVRPMIDISRKDIEKYLHTLKVSPRIDETNAQTHFLRNRLRHGILRDLEKINPQIKLVLSRYAEQAAIDYDFLYQEAKRHLQVKAAKLVVIDLRRFRALHLSLRRMIVRCAFEQLAGDLRVFSAQHCDEVLDLAEHRPKGSIVHITKTISVVTTRSQIIFRKT